jgi:hypothetical protein
MMAGDRCIVLPGNYGERVHITTSGSSDAPITYLAEGTVTTKGFTVEADYITIKSFYITDTDDHWRDGVGIFVKGSHCVIEDNYVHFATRGGIWLYADPADAPFTSDCIIRNNRLYRNAVSGIEVYGRNHLVEDNEIWRTIQYHPTWTNPSSVDADGMRFFGTGHKIRKNHIHDITYDDPENVNPHIDCFQTWGPAYDIVFEQNFCEVLEFQTQLEGGQGFMISEQNAPVRNLTIINNVLQAFGHLNVFDCENLVIVNNTLTSDPSFYSLHRSSIILTNSLSATVKNNIFYNIYRPLSTDESSQRRLDAGYNNVYRGDGQPLEGSPSPHDLWDVNPQFLNPAANDFHLRSYSPCVDAGINAGITEDFDGIPRPQEAGYDIGAYEYAAGIFPEIYLPLILKRFI